MTQKMKEIELNRVQREIKLKAMNGKMLRGRQKDTIKK